MINTDIDKFMSITFAFTFVAIIILSFSFFIKLIFFDETSQWQKRIDIYTGCQEKNDKETCFKLLNLTGKEEKSENN